MHVSRPYPFIALCSACALLAGVSAFAAGSSNGASGSSLVVPASQSGSALPVTNPSPSQVVPSAHSNAVVANSATIENTEEEETVPELSTEVLRHHLLSDEEINLRCQASILARRDMVNVTNEEGQVTQVPRCVRTYQVKREVAQNYLNEADKAQAKVANSSQGCNEAASRGVDQSSCIKIGENLLSTAAGLHEKLAHVASDSEGQLADVAR